MFCDVLCWLFIVARLLLFCTGLCWFITLRRLLVAMCLYVSWLMLFGVLVRVVGIVASYVSS